MSELTIFPDTNLFLHCRAIHELPWHEEFEFTVLQLKIAASVIEEIERLKRDQNQRRARRAREASSLFGRMLSNASESESFEVAGKSIVVSFAPTLPALRETPAMLDRTRGDDSLIEEVLCFSHACAGVILLTGDILLDLRARRHSVATKQIPDSWALAPETDEREKRIRDLEARIGRLEEASPNLSIEVLIDNVTVDTLAIPVDHYSPLSKDEIQFVLAQLRAKHPVQTQFAAPPKPAPRNEIEKRLLESIGPLMIEVSKEDIDNYTSEYNKWQLAAQEDLSRLHARLNAKYRWKAIVIEIDNTGPVSADHLLLEVELFDGLRACVSAQPSELPKLYRQARQLSDFPQFPSPPSPPRVMTSLEKAIGGGRIDTSVTDYLFPLPSSLGIPDLPSPPDRHSFQTREDEDTARSKWSFECPDFRHGRGRRAIVCYVMVPAGVATAKARLFIRATARNMPEPFERHWPVELTFREHSTFENAKKWTLREKVNSRSRDEQSDFDDSS